MEFGMTIALKLDPAVQERIDVLAKAQHRPAEVLMQEALAEYVDREEKRQSFLQDALDSWAEYQATGLHVTHAEVDAWLAKLETGQYVPPPECHT